MSSNRSLRKSVGAKSGEVEANISDPVQTKKRGRLSLAAPTTVNSKIVGKSSSSIASSGEEIIENFGGIPIKDMGVQALREHLKRLGKPAAGRKEELVATLLAAVNPADDSAPSKEMASATKRARRTPSKYRSSSPELPQELPSTPVVPQSRKKPSRKSELSPSVSVTAASGTAASGTRASSRTPKAKGVVEEDHVEAKPIVQKKPVSVLKTVETVPSRTLETVPSPEDSRRGKGRRSTAPSGSSDSPAEQAKRAVTQSPVSTTPERPSPLSRRESPVVEKEVEAVTVALPAPRPLAASTQADEENMETFMKEHSDEVSVSSDDDTESGEEEQEDEEDEDEDEDEYEDEDEDEEDDEDEDAGPVLRRSCPNDVIELLSGSEDEEEYFPSPEKAVLPTFPVSFAAAFEGLPRLPFAPKLASGTVAATSAVTWPVNVADARTAAATMTTTPAGVALATSSSSLSASVTTSLSAKSPPADLFAPFPTQPVSQSSPVKVKPFTPSESAWGVAAGAAGTAVASSSLQIDAQHVVEMTPVEPCQSVVPNGINNSDNLLQMLTTRFTESIRGTGAPLSDEEHAIMSGLLNASRAQPLASLPARSPSAPEPPIVPRRYPDLPFSKPQAGTAAVSSVYRQPAPQAAASSQFPASAARGAESRWLETSPLHNESNQLKRAQASFFGPAGSDSISSASKRRIVENAWGGAVSSPVVNERAVQQMAFHSGYAERTFATRSLAPVPVFKQNAAKFSSSLIQPTPGGQDLKRDMLVSTLQRRNALKAERQQPFPVAKGPATVAKRILQTLNDISSPIEEQRSKPVAALWNAPKEPPQLAYNRFAREADKFAGPSVGRADAPNSFTPKSLASPFPSVETSAARDGLISADFGGGRGSKDARHGASSYTENNRNFANSDSDGEFAFSKPVPIIEELDSSPVKLYHDQDQDHLKMQYIFSPPSKASRANKIRDENLATKKSEAESIPLKNVDAVNSASSAPKLSIWQMAQNKWKCDVCLVQNEKTIDVCVGCDSKKGAVACMGADIEKSQGSASDTEQTKFTGFASAAAPLTTAGSIGAGGFVFGGLPPPTGAPAPVSAAPSFAAPAVTKAPASALGAFQFGSPAASAVEKQPANVAVPKPAGLFTPSAQGGGSTGSHAFPSTLSAPASSLSAPTPAFSFSAAPAAPSVAARNESSAAPAVTAFSFGDKQPEKTAAPAATSAGTATPFVPAPTSAQAPMAAVSSADSQPVVPAAASFPTFGVVSDAKPTIPMFGLSTSAAPSYLNVANIVTASKESSVNPFGGGLPSAAANAAPFDTKAAGSTPLFQGFGTKPFSAGVAASTPAKDTSSADEATSSSKAAAPVSAAFALAPNPSVAAAASFAPTSSFTFPAVGAPAASSTGSFMFGASAQQSTPAALASTGAPKIENAFLGQQNAVQTSFDNELNKQTLAAAAAAAAPALSFGAPPVKETSPNDPGTPRSTRADSSCMQAGDSPMSTMDTGYASESGSVISTVVLPPPMNAITAPNLFGGTQPASMFGPFGGTDSKSNAPNVFAPQMGANPFLFNPGSASSTANTGGSALFSSGAGAGMFSAAPAGAPPANSIFGSAGAGMFGTGQVAVAPTGIFGSTAPAAISAPPAPFSFSSSNNQAPSQQGAPIFGAPATSGMGSMPAYAGFGAAPVNPAPVAGQFGSSNLLQSGSGPFGGAVEDTGFSNGTAQRRKVKASHKLKK